jgi:TldD protein
MQVLDPAKGAKAAAPRGTNTRLYTDADPLSAIPFARKVALCQEIDAAARARDPRVKQVTVSLAARGASSRSSGRTASSRMTCARWSA